MTAGPAIEVRDLHFAYRGAPREVLGGVSLTVEPGRRVLVIGANGAGKTTLLRILAGQHTVDPARAGSGRLRSTTRPSRGASSFSAGDSRSTSTCASTRSSRGRSRSIRRGAT